MKLLDKNELPHGMSYPIEFERLVERQLTWFEPWWVLDAALAKDRIKGMLDRYPGRHLLPFAKREDNDDVACFELESPGKVVIVHDFASDGWERREVLDNFYAWIRRAVEDMIAFDAADSYRSP